jgi:hypothetical protein
MEALYKINGSTTIKVEGADTQGLIEQLTVVRKAIGHEICGRCNSADTFPNHRKVKKFNYYELKCGGCGAVLQLGTNQNDEKTLFKKVMEYDTDGTAIPGTYAKNGGWKKWNPETKEMD